MKSDFFSWTKNNKLLLLGILLFIIIPIFIAHILFSIPACNEYWTAKWSPGDLLNYFGASLAFLGTIVLGSVSLYQNNKLHEINQGLLHAQYKPVITVSHTFDEKQENEKNRTFYRAVKRKDNALLDTGWSQEPTCYPYAKASFSNIGMAPALEVNLHWYELKGIIGLDCLEKFFNTDIENFYEKIDFSPFTYIKENEIKKDAMLIYTEFDLGISSETNKLNLMFSFEESAMPFHSIIQITYKDLLGHNYKKKLYLGHDGNSPWFYPISKEYLINTNNSSLEKSRRELQ